MGYRRKARECAMQMLFQLDMTGDDPRRVQRSFYQSNPVPEASRKYADRLIEGAAEHLPAIDETLDRVAHNWRLDRMPGVDRAVLRLAVYELLYEPDIPRKVAINEAIEIAKRYSSDESGNFVNGVLDGVKRDLEAVAG